MELSFAVHKLEKFSASPGKVHFEVLIHLLRYIRDNKTFGMKYYAYINDAPVSDLLRQASIKTKNLFMAFSDLETWLSSFLSFPRYTHILGLNSVMSGLKTPPKVYQSGHD